MSVLESSCFRTSSNQGTQLGHRPTPEYVIHRDLEPLRTPCKGGRVVSRGRRDAGRTPAGTAAGGWRARHGSGQGWRSRRPTVCSASHFASDARSPDPTGAGNHARLHGGCIFCCACCNLQGGALEVSNRWALSSLLVISRSRVQLRPPAPVFFITSTALLDAIPLVGCSELQLVATPSRSAALRSAPGRSTVKVSGCV